MKKFAVLRKSYNTLKNTSDSLQNVVNSAKAKMSPQALVEKGLWRVSPCFEGETLVHTDGEPREIQWIRVADKVLSRSEITGEQCYRKVVKTFLHEDVQTYDVYYATQFGDSEGVSTTANHQFWVRGHGWVEASRLQHGQVLEICDPDGRDEIDRSMGSWQELALSGERWFATVDKVEKPELKTTVYNFEVEDFHTYFVGAHGVWVHNDCTPTEIPLVRSTPNATPFTKYAPKIEQMMLKKEKLLRQGKVR